MKTRSLLAAGLIALGAAFGMSAIPDKAEATIGPYGGRWLTAVAPSYAVVFNTPSVYYGAYIQGTGGSQTINYRVRYYLNGQWTYFDSYTHNVASGSSNYEVGDYTTPCPWVGTRIVQTEAKWNSWAWSQADRSPGKNVTCG